MVQNYFWVSTQESPDPLSPELPISRFSISRNGRSLDAWPPLIRWLRSIPRFSSWKILNSLSTGIPIARFSISRNGRSLDVWPPLIRQLRSIMGFSSWKIPNSLSTGIPILRFLISRNGRSYDMWPPLIGRLRSIPGFFAPIHRSLNPRVTPEKSNGCWVFQSISDSSNRFPTRVLSPDFLNVEGSTVRILPWTLGIYGPKLFTTHEDTGKQSGKASNVLLSPTNLRVVGDHRFPNKISSVD
jgi:hypothetical protein